MVCGHNFEQGRDLDAIMDKMLSSGFQATNLGQAIKVVNEMVRCCFASCCFKGVLFMRAAMVTH